MDEQQWSSGLTDQYHQLLQEVSEKHQVDLQLLQNLIAFEATKVHMQRRRGAKDGLRKLIEDWLEEKQA
ncbi:DNA modification system-associated small protein [Chloroflexota bacterium]